MAKFVKLLYILYHWFRRRNHSKAFLIWSFCGSIVQWSGTICAKLVEDTIGDSSVKLTCFWARCSGGTSVKRSFLARALAVILFKRVEHLVTNLNA